MATARPCTRVILSKAKDLCIGLPFMRLPEISSFSPAITQAVNP